VTVEVPFTTAGVSWARALTMVCWLLCVELDDEAAAVVVVEGVEVAADAGGVTVADVAVVAAVDAAGLDAAGLGVVDVVLADVIDGMTDSQFTVILLPSMFADLEAATVVFCADGLEDTEIVGSNSV
jgi:hypothetical protein